MISHQAGCTPSFNSMRIWRRQVNLPVYAMHFYCHSSTLWMFELQKLSLSGETSRPEQEDKKEQGNGKEQQNQKNLVRKGTEYSFQGSIP